MLAPLCACDAVLKPANALVLVKAVREDRKRGRSMVAAVARQSGLVGMARWSPLIDAEGEIATDTDT